MKEYILDSTAGLQSVFDDIQKDFEDSDFTQPLTESLVDLQQQEQRMFEQERASNGEAWTPLKPATIKAKGHDVILHETGALGTSLFDQTQDSIREVQSHGLVFGTDDHKAPFHQEGTANMPARPPVGIAEETLDKIVSRVADSQAEQLKG